MLSHSHRHQITRPALLGGQRKPSACISSSSYQVAQTNQCHGMQYITVTMSLQNSLFHKSASLMGAGLRDHCYVSLLPALSCGVWGLTLSGGVWGLTLSYGVWGLTPLWSVRLNFQLWNVRLNSQLWILEFVTVLFWEPDHQRHSPATFWVSFLSV